MSSNLVTRMMRQFVETSAARPVEDDALLAFLVGSIHSALAPLVASIALAMLITLAAFLMTGSPLFLLAAAAHVAIGVARLHRLAVYERLNARGFSAREIVEFDFAFAVWSALYALTLGLTCYWLTSFEAADDAFALALAACTGFTLAFVTRSASRPRTLMLQVLGIAGPQFYALLTLRIQHGAIYAILVVGLAAAALIMGRHGYQRIVALFRADDANRRLARHDMLTGLLNRFSFNQAFSVALDEVAARPSESMALFIVDLDRFKEINDTLGHAVGDAVIVETARRLAEIAGPECKVARMGGDEFMILSRGPRISREVAAAMGQALTRSLSRPIEIDRVAVPSSASIGVALYPEHGREMAELMKHADFALYESKHAGRGCCTLFDATMQNRMAEERLLEIDLDRAIREDQFEVWYQPVQNLETGALCGYEALVRWRHPTRGLVFPDVFVPLAEQNGSILAIGQIVLEKAAQAAAGWDQRLSVSVNVSPSQFRRPEPLLEGIRRALDMSGLEPSRLHLEITESLLMEDTPKTRAAINQLADWGVKFSLDDFGAGYSSLAYIQAYPFSEIKIDRKFVADIADNRVSSAIVASVCVLADRINMRVIAEGVETQLQSRALRALGVKQGQGYLYGRPARIAHGPQPQLQLVASR